MSSGIDSHSWLYLSGYPVVCNRYMEVAALVSAINPTLNITSTCQEVEELQKQLLWLLYDLGHLKKYPMALGTLGELEEATSTPERPSCEQLFTEAVKSAKNSYKNHHVYPYTYQGCYYSRKKMYREAFASWANAGDVIRLYNYSRDDEEIYKEFLEIANESIPQIMKLESSGHSGKSILRDSHCFANLLRFYDGICQWEEGSLTPILHIGWAKPLVSTIAKFDYDIRSQVIINCESDDEEIKINNSSVAAVTGSGDDNVESKLNNNNNNNTLTKVELDVTKKDDPLISTLQALTAACGEKILNPDYLLQGGGQPFTELLNNEGETSTNASPSPTSPAVVQKVSSEAPSARTVSPLPSTLLVKVSNVCNDDEILTPKRPIITLYSQKMKGLKNLLLAERLNTHAISLQVTAQSQVQVGGKKGRFHINFAGSSNNTTFEVEGSTRPKRNRRE